VRLLMRSDVIPAFAGIYHKAEALRMLDSRLRGNDKVEAVAGIVAPKQKPRKPAAFLYVDAGKRAL